MNLTEFVLAVLFAVSTAIAVANWSDDRDPCAVHPRTCHLVRLN